MVVLEFRALVMTLKYRRKKQKQRREKTNLTQFPTVIQKD